MKFVNKFFKVTTLRVLVPSTIFSFVQDANEKMNYTWYTDPNYLSATWHDRNIVLASMRRPPAGKGFYQGSTHCWGGHPPCPAVSPGSQESSGRPRPHPHTPALAPPPPGGHSPPWTWYWKSQSQATSAHCHTGVGWRGKSTISMCSSGLDFKPNAEELT